MPTEPARIRADGLELAYLEDGPADGPLALCLHGFPDAAPTWRHLLPVLASAGFHAVAPWLRGYAPSEVPADGRYQTGASVADVTALHEAFGADSNAVLIGHDWGAMIAYGAAGFTPERWSRLVTMAVPPPGATAGGFFTYDQLKRSFYMFVFQHPLAEVIVSADDLGFIDRLWEDWSPGYDASADLPHVKAALRNPANLAAALGYYRSTLGTTEPDPALAAEQAATQQSPPQPTLYLHGTDDGCVGSDLAAAAPAFLPSPESRFERLDGCGHFLHLEKPDEVNRLVLDFLR
jgi:pimeloyl-ACP methyl ester carboxylesterase